MSLRAWLWDLDGVLVDSYDVWFELVNATAREFDAPPISRATFAAAWGQGIEADVRRFWPARTIAETEVFYFAHFMDHAEHLRFDPEARPVVEALRARGLAQAVVTNTPADLARRILVRGGLELDCVVGGTDVEHPKPAPDGVLEACRRLGVTPAEALLVGDSRFDRQAAAAAGARFAGLRCDGDARVERLSELIELSRRGR